MRGMPWDDAQAMTACPEYGSNHHHAADSTVCLCGLHTLQSRQMPVTCNLCTGLAKCCC